MLLAQMMVWMLGLYFGAGILFALFFVTTGITRIDATTKQSGWGFRLLMLPGGVALWPLLLPRVIAGKTQPPFENNAHRRAARKVQA